MSDEHTLELKEGWVNYEDFPYKLTDMRIVRISIVVLLMYSIPSAIFAIRTNNYLLAALVAFAVVGCLFLIPILKKALPQNKLREALRDFYGAEAVFINTDGTVVIHLNNKSYSGRLEKRDRFARIIDVKFNYELSFMDSLMKHI